MSKRTRERWRRERAARSPPHAASVPDSQGGSGGQCAPDAPVDVGIQKTGNPANPIKGVALPVLGVVSFIDHTWSPRFSSSAGYSMVNIQDANGDLPSAYHQGHYAVGNLLFYPVKQVMMGTEFQFGRRVNFADGSNTNDYRVQFSVRYDWAKAFGFDR